jgi:hypothetical protein
MSCSSRCGVRRRTLLCLLAAGALPVATRALAAEAPPEVRAALPAARLRGAGQLRFLGALVYDARLWTRAAPARADVLDEPLALELRYARRLRGAAIAERSLVEMRRGGPLDDGDAQRWLAELQALIPDVHAGDRLTGVLEPDAGMRLYFNGERRGAVADAQFARRFFGIWLAPHTSEPALRAALLGAPR